MSKWDQYEEKIPSFQEKWSEYEELPERIKESSGDAFLPLLGKSALKGVTSLIDLPKNILQLGEGANNLAKQGLNYATDSDYYSPTNYTDYIPDTSDARRFLKDKLNWDLEPHPSSPAQEILAHGVDFAASGGPLGLVGKAAKGLSIIDKFKKVGGATALGGIIGTTSGAAQVAGVDPLIADIGSSLLVPSALNTGAIKNKLGAKLLGLTPKNLNQTLSPLSKTSRLDLANAAKDLDIDLPLNVISGTRAANLADEIVSKAPFAGDKLRAKYRAVDPRIGKTLDDIYDSVGQEKTEVVKDLIRSKYDAAIKNLPSDAMIPASKTVEEIDKIASSFSGIPSLNKQEKALLGTVSKIKKSFAPYGVKNIPIPVDILQKQKRSLNAVIKDLKEDAGVQDLIKGVKVGIDKDIATYGAKNSDWFKQYKDADSFYASVAKRKDLQNHLDQSINSATGSVKYNRLSDLINSSKYKDFLKKTTSSTPETYNKIKKLGVVAEAFAVKNANIANPSGTAMVNTVMKVLNAPIINSASNYLVLSATSGLLTNKEFLDTAIKYASNPSIRNGFVLNKIIKDITGYTAISLNKALSND